mgnify:CR=1 FL=1
MMEDQPIVLLLNGVFKEIEDNRVTRDSAQKFTEFARLITGETKETQKQDNVELVLSVISNIGGQLQNQVPFKDGINIFMSNYGVDIKSLIMNFDIDEIKREAQKITDSEESQLIFKAIIFISIYLLFGRSNDENNDQTKPINTSRYKSSDSKPELTTKVY